MLQKKSYMNFILLYGIINLTIIEIIKFKSHMCKINERIFELPEVMDKSKKNDEVNTSHLKRMNKLLLFLNIAMQNISAID